MFGAVALGGYYICRACDDERIFDDLSLMRADDDGMAQPFIRLEGIKVPRALSWAEERALRKDLADWAGGAFVIRTSRHDEGICSTP